MNSELLIRVRRETREDVLARDPLRDFAVWWLDIKPAHVTAFRRRLKTARVERDLQVFLETNSMLLAQHLRGGHGRWVIPQKRLGAEHVTDFVIGESSSMGFEWAAVELESPHAPMFTRAGDPSRQLTHAIRQIQDWRAWLQRNQNYAARPIAEGGLGLTDIVAAIPGLILIGRRDSIDPATNERRRQMVNDLNIEIHSYDFLLGTIRTQATIVKKMKLARTARKPSGKAG